MNTAERAALATAVAAAGPILLALLLVLAPLPLSGQEGVPTRTARVIWPSGNQHQDGYTGARIDVAYKPASCADNLVISLGMRKATFQPDGSYWYKGNLYVLAGDLGTIPPPDVKGVLVSGSVYRSGAVIGSISERAYDNDDAGCLWGQNARVGAMDTYLPKPRATEQVNAFLATVQLPAQILEKKPLTNYRIENAIQAQLREKERAEKARIAAAEERERQERERQERAEREAREREQREAAERDRQQREAAERERQQTDQQRDNDLRRQQNQRDQDAAQERMAREREAEAQRVEQERALERSKEAARQLAEARAPLIRAGVEKCMQADYARQAHENERASALYREILELSASGAYIEQSCLEQAQESARLDKTMALMNLMEDVYAATGISLGFTVAILPIADTAGDKVHSWNAGLSVGYSFFFADLLLGDAALGPLVPIQEPDFSQLGCSGPYGKDNWGGDCAQYYEGSELEWGTNYMVNLGVVSPLGLGSLFPVGFIGYVDTVNHGVQKQYGLGIIWGSTRTTQSGREVFDEGSLRLGIAKAPGGTSFQIAAMYAF